MQTDAEKCDSLICAKVIRMAESSTGLQFRRLSMETNFHMMSEFGRQSNTQMEMTGERAST